MREKNTLKTETIYIYKASRLFEYYTRDDERSACKYKREKKRENKTRSIELEFDYAKPEILGVRGREEANLQLLFQDK